MLQPHYATGRRGLSEREIKENKEENIGYHTRFMYLNSLRTTFIGRTAILIHKFNDTGCLKNF